MHVGFVLTMALGSCLVLKTKIVELCLDGLQFRVRHLYLAQHCNVLLFCHRFVLYAVVGH